jgi:ASC-1-like (ASCH) protein
MTDFLGELQDKYFRQIKSGTKTWELRPCRNKWADMVPRQTIFFTNIETKETMLTRIDVIRDYSSFEEAVSAVGYQYLMPDLRSDEEAISAYRSIGDYRDWQGGVRVFRLTVL